MLNFIIKRLLTSILVIIGVTIVIFSLVHMAPGDPVQMMAGLDAKEEDIEALRAKMGMDKPLIVQYFNYVKGLLHLDLGKSIITNKNISDEIFFRFRNTAELAVAGMLISSVFGIIIGIIAAVNRDRWLDKTLMSLSITGISMPSFLLALLLTGCAKEGQETFQLRLFYPASEFEAGGDVLHSQAVDWSKEDSKDTAEQVEKVIELLLNNDKVLDFTSPIPQGTKLLSCKVSGGEAVVNFSPNYGRLSGFDLTVANYCITLSASQIPGVRRIHILIDGESLSGQDDALSTGDVLLTSSEDVVKAVPVVLYFPDSTGELQPEKRELLIYEGENHCQRVLEALSEGPNTEGLYALVPEGIHIAGVWMDGDICCLNFSLTDYRALCESTVDQGMLVEGLVKSLCSLKGVERVQFMVNGTYRTRLGVVDIENPIRP